MKSVDEVEQLIERANAIPSAEMNHRTLNDVFIAQEASKRARAASLQPKLWRVVLWRRIGYLAAALLVFFSCLACILLSGKVSDLSGKVDSLKAALATAQQDTPLAPLDDTTTINLYLKEHQDILARHASVNTAASQPTQMRVSQHDVLYYEFFDNAPEYMRPGMIVRGPSSRRQLSESETPVISNGYTIGLSEARETADFALQAPVRLHPGFSLDQIRRIDGRDALQLLYTDGINSVSLFEQPLDGRRSLSRQDFREYAVYRKTEQRAGTILAWRDDALSYVLIGNTDMSQLMNMAQSISTGN